MLVDGKDKLVEAWSAQEPRLVDEQPPPALLVVLEPVGGEL